MLPVTHRVRELIAKGAHYSDVLAAAREQGMRLMIEHGREKIAQGITTPSEVMHAVFTALDFIFLSLFS